MKKQIVGLLVTSVALAGQWGCGGSSGPSAPSAVATPAPAPTPQAPVVLLQGAFALPVGFLVAFRTLTISSSGVMEITVDWTFAKNDLDIALVRGACTQQMFDAGACDFVGFADSATTKPEKLRLNVAAGTYTPMAVNFGPDDESGAVQIVFTAGATTSSAPAGSVWKPKGLVKILPSGR